MTEYDQAKQCLAEVSRRIGELDAAAREKANRFSTDDAKRLVWERFYDEVEPLRRQRDNLINTMVQIINLQRIPAMIIDQQERNTK